MKKEEEIIVIFVVVVTEHIDIENGFCFEGVNEKVMQYREEYHKYKHCTSNP